MHTSYLAYYPDIFATLAYELNNTGGGKFIRLVSVYIGLYPLSFSLNTKTVSRLTLKKFLEEHLISL